MGYIWLKTGKGTYGSNDTTINENDLLNPSPEEEGSGINISGIGLIDVNQNNSNFLISLNPAFTSQIVTYTGADNDVDLGEHTLKLGKEINLTDIGKFRNLLMSANNNFSLLRTQHLTRDTPTSSTYTNTSNIGLGEGTLEENIGVNVNAIGGNAAQYNKANDCNGFGAYSIQDNEGANCNGFGTYSLQFNKGSRCEGTGYESLMNNQGDDVIGVGIFSCKNNKGNRIIGLGQNTLKDNEEDDNIAIGNNSFNTPNTTISNTVVIGTNSQPDKSNQVVLGNSNTEEVLSTGEFTNRVAGKGVILRTPDDTKSYRISLDNSGNLITTLI